MVQKQAEAAAKAGNRQSKSRKKPPAGGRRREKPKDQPRRLFALKAATVSTFTIGGGAVDVVLTGTGLDIPGLNVAFLHPDHDNEVQGDEVIFEHPQKDDLSSSEYPMTVKVVAGNPGPRRLAMTFLILTDAGPVLLVSAVPARFET